MVEFKGLGVLAPFGCLLQQVEPVLDLNDLHGRAALRKITEHHAFHGHPLEDDLIDDARVDGGNDRALAGNDLHKVVLLQPLQHAADGGARNTEPLAQLVLAQCFPGQDLQRTDLVFQDMIDLIGVLLCGHGCISVFR